MTSWAWAFLIIVVLFSNKLREWFKNHENKFTPFAFLGKYSFGIYLSHVYVLIVLNKLPIEPIGLLIGYLLQLRHFY